MLFNERRTKDRNADTEAFKKASGYDLAEVGDFREHWQNRRRPRRNQAASQILKTRRPRRVVIVSDTSYCAELLWVPDSKAP